MNFVAMMGRLTKDPEVRYTQGQTQMAIANFSLAVDRRFKRENEPDADFFNCSAFGKTAEFIEKYCKKGTKLVIQGRLQNDSYEKDGQKKTITKIIVEQTEFAESKKASEGNDQGSMENQNNNPPAPDGFMQIPSDLGEALPFG